MNRFQVIGVNDERDFCECCGKKGLKRVVWISDTETGEVKHFGTTCATAPVKGFALDKEIKDAVAKFSSREKMLGYLAAQAYKKLGGQYIANPDGYSWSAADPALLAQCRTQQAAHGFNY